MKDSRSDHQQKESNALELRVQFFEVEREDYSAFSRIARIVSPGVV